MVAPQFGQGQNAADGLAEYERYMPGNPIPNDLTCENSNGFYERLQVLCRSEGGSYCEHGYVVARDGIIIHTTFFRCDFPVAYLTAEYGRYEQVRRYTKVIVLRWPNAYAHIHRNGWLNAMASVSIVTWWRPPPTEGQDSW
jgi:hypothetical protein